MADKQLIVWRDGKIVDDEVIPARPWSFVAGLLAFVLLADLALGWATQLRETPHDPQLESPTDVRRMLADAVADEGHPYLLIGDSVLAGDVMHGRIADWKQHRVIDAMRRAANPESGARFHQVALDALLPVDILHVVQELDGYDPAGRIPVVIEINPRYFSPSYAQHAGCTRGWLCEIGPTLLTKNGEWRLHVVTPWAWGLVLGAIADYTPLLRLRSELRGEFVDRAVATLLPRRESEQPDVLAAGARVLAHYTELNLRNTSKQVQALNSTLARLRATGRRALFFTTPLEDGFLGEAMDPQQYGRYIARMSELVDRSAAPQVELVNLDHPLFSSSLFLDHCHLGPEGNRRLAVNLLAELGIGLAEVPDDDELVDLELPDRTVVSRAEQGHNDGASWQALFNHPSGIAVAPGGHRVVIADTGNHVLRELSGNLRTVRTILGAPGEAGDVDGSRARSRLDRPAFPVMIGNAVYFSDQKGKKLRAYIGGTSRTMSILAGERFAKISGLAAHGDRLLILDRNQRVLELDVASSTTRVVVEAREGLKIKVFAVAPDDRIFLADQDDRIWMGDLAQAPITVGEEGEGMELEFPNTGKAVMPQAKGLYFPFDYDRIRFANIVGMTWVDRYGTLLVQDDIPVERVPKELTGPLTERIQLRMIDPRSQLVYPWLKPLVHGGGYMLYNKRSDSFSSYFHEGSMALDQETATLFWLERNRSRLFYVADGVLGTSKIGHIRDLFAHGFRDLLGHRSATQAFSAFRPQRFLDRRLERLPREGPYQGVIIGSSMLSKSDMIGSYSFGVRLEGRLRDALGYRDGVGFDLFQRSYGGVPSERVLQELRSMLDAGAQFDVIFIELCGSRNRFFETGATDERMREILAEVDDIARQYESMVIFFDDSALVAAQRDGNRGTPDSERRFQEMARQAGYQVIDLGAELTRDALELSPFGSAPYRSHHAAPWAIDEAADMLGARAYPVLREHLRGRVPAYLRAPLDLSQDRGSVADVFAEVDADWQSFLPGVTDASAQSTLVGDELRIFVDLGRIEVDATSTDALDDIAVAALHMFIVGDPAGARARKVDVQLANFRRYDEYGAGARDAAQVVRRHQLDRDGVIELLTQARARARP